MKKEARDNFKTFINRKFLDWERDTGSRKNFVEFAEYLGVPRGSGA